MLFSLLHQVDSPEGSLVRHLLRLHVFRREEQLLGVEQQHARLGARVDHRVGFLERDTQRLFANDVLAGFGGVDRDLRVQAVGRGDRDQLDLGIAQQIVIIAVRVRDAVALGEIRRVAFGRRRDRHQLGLFRDRFHGARNAIGLEARADDADSYFGHGRGRQNTCARGSWTGSQSPRDRRHIHAASSD